jgi:hypothetical protein
MNSIKFLDAVKRKYNVTDYGSAPLLGVTKAQISGVRTGRSGFGEKPAVRIAALLNLPAEQVLAELRAEKAETDELKALWLNIAAKFAACFLLVISLAPVQPAYAMHQRLDITHSPQFLEPHNINMAFPGWVGL